MTLQLALFASALPLATAATATVAIGRHEVRTVSVPQDVKLISATYTPSGSILVTSGDRASDPRSIKLATMNDDGTGYRQFFAGRLPDRPKDNGLRYMVFPDNRRIFTGDFVIECRQALEKCANPEVLPVTYPAEVADGAHIGSRWSEIIVAPDNKTIAWTTLLAGYTAAAVLVGEMRREGAGYVIAGPKIISTIDAFKPDPKHPDGVIPQPVRGGEVKQFVDGGAAISLVGAVRRDLPNSAVQHLGSGVKEAITDTPGYTETTIFSPDERLGVVMTTRFSPETDLAVLGLLPRPHPASLNMGLSMFAYTHGVTGVRRGRPGNIGPALIDIEASKTRAGYSGINLNISPDWAFGSPMSWHPSSQKAIWMEFQKGVGTRRIQLVELPEYRAGLAVRPKPMPAIPYASTDLSVIPSLVDRSQNIDVKVYGKASGHIAYRRTPARIEKEYFGYSDDGRNVWSGRETTDFNMAGNSAYAANVKLTGEAKGEMDLRVTFGPLGAKSPAQLIFAPDASGMPQTRGFAELEGRRLDVSTLTP